MKYLFAHLLNSSYSFFECEKTCEYVFDCNLSESSSVCVWDGIITIGKWKSTKKLFSLNIFQVQSLG